MIQKKTDTYNDGVVEIYRLEDISEPGRAPSVTRGKLKASLRFSEKTVGVNRFFTAKEHVGEIERVIQCLRREDITPRDEASISYSGMERVYTIAQIQYISSDIMQLSLVRIDRDGVANG